jgi:cobalt-precorrin 5A hydrolase
VRVAGLGFRAQVDLPALREALQRAGGTAGLTALATAADKATAPALLALAAELNLPVVAVPLAQLSSQAATPSPHVPERYGAHSLAEAAALAAAGPGARLVAARAVSGNRMATAAIAENTPL